MVDEVPDGDDGAGQGDEGLDHLARTSVHSWSPRNPRVCHELVRSITQRRPACRGLECDVSSGVKPWV